MVDGHLKDPGVYTFIPPESLGRTNTIIPGKNSGTRALQWCAAQLGYQVDSEQVNRLKKLLYMHRLADTEQEPWQVLKRCLRLVTENVNTHATKSTEVCYED
jgi:isopropylmalate/homocitrate/citramalate synthase